MGHLATEVDGSISVLAAGVGGVVIVYLQLKYTVVHGGIPGIVKL